MTRTGKYLAGFENAGGIAAVLFLLSVISGSMTAVLLRTNKPFVQALPAVAVLICWMAGLLEGGWWLALYLVGTLLSLAACASGKGAALTFSGVIALTLAAIIGTGILLAGLVPSKTAVGDDLEKLWHRLCWEDGHNPMPEGDLKELEPFTPEDEPALEVTMQQWMPVYLRGFTAGRYTGSGWEPVESENLAGIADELYAIQENYFVPAAQIYAAALTAGDTTENTITVNNIGACRAYTYLPYGAGDVTGDVLPGEELLWEGTYGPEDGQYSAQLYDIMDSYLLQPKLKESVDTPYRAAEGVYRQWVYETYLTIPQETKDVLAACFSVKDGITTVEAKREIMEFLQEIITYDETVLTKIGNKNFLSYVLEVSQSGYSVHYATLATLLLRYCGIPARYVEGYVVTPSQAEALRSGESLTLTQANSHAWAEYYLDGVGWLPFDATPGYSDILTFELPADGQPAGAGGGSGIQMQEHPNPPEKKPQVEEENNNSQRIFIREAVCVLLLLLLAAALVLILRTVILRQRLRKRQKRFDDPDARRACACILSYMQELMTGMEPSCRDLPVSMLAKKIAELLDRQMWEPELGLLINEVWYSTHPIPQEKIQLAMLWMKTAQDTWKKKVSLPRRFKQRFITCKIL